MRGAEDHVVSVVDTAHRARYFQRLVESLVYLASDFQCQRCADTGGHAGGHRLRVADCQRAVFGSQADQAFEYRRAVGGAGAAGIVAQVDEHHRLFVTRHRFLHPVVDRIKRSHCQQLLAPVP